MKLDKVTKNAVRFADQDGHNIYFTKEEVATLLGGADEITLNIEKTK